MGDDVSDHFGVSDACGVFSFADHDIGDLMTVTEIDSTTFTVTIGDPALTFSDTSDRTIDFKIRMMLSGGPPEVPDTWWYVDGTFKLTMEYCLNL